MAELQPPDIPILADPPPISTTATSSAAPPPISTTATSQIPPPATTTTTPTTIIAPTISNTGYLGPGLAPKRQRRPSVRLGEIGDQSFDHSHPHPRRPKTWRFHKHPSLAAKTSKTRPLTNLVNGYTYYRRHQASLHNNDDNTNYNFVFLGSKKTKSKKPTKRVRSNWASSASAGQFEATAANGGLPIVDNNSGFRDENQENGQFRYLEAEASESPIKEHSSVHSMDNQNMGLQFWDRRAGVRARLSHSESLDIDCHENNLNFDYTINGFRNEINSGDDNRSSGVRDWLIGLGMGRYAPVFEIHEVDDEVLPMLTLEDLKDMGINAVGSRGKMYSAIVKLRKGFS